MVKAQKRKVAHPQHQGTRLALDTSLPRSRGAASGQKAEPPCVSFAGWWRSAEAASVLMPLQVYHAASVPRPARGRPLCHKEFQPWERRREKHGGRSDAGHGARCGTRARRGGSFPRPVVTGSLVRQRRQACGGGDRRSAAPKPPTHAGAVTCRRNWNRPFSRSQPVVEQGPACLAGGR